MTIGLIAGWIELRDVSIVAATPSINVWTMGARSLMGGLISEER
jgi:hypothetical protein